MLTLYRCVVIFRARLLCTSKAKWAVFVHSLAKSERGNIMPDDLATLNGLASHIVSYDDKALAQAVAFGTLIEATCHERK